MQTSHFAPRQFLPETIDLTDTAQLAPVFEKLDVKLGRAAAVADLEAWLRDHSEVCAALGESSSLAYIAMTCQTDDPEREKAYMHIVEVVDPWLKPRQFALMQKLAQSPFFSQLPPFYAVYQRSVETQVKIYREENVARETEIARLTQQYQKISGAMTAQFDGQEQTLARMGRIQEEPDRPRREAAWKAVADRRLADADKLEELFDKLLALRNAIARAAGFADFRAYTFASYERFDYTPEDCLRFHDAIEHHVVPLARELQEERRRKLGVGRLRPWDLAVDPDHNPPLHPFAASSELLEKCHEIFEKLDPRLGDYYSVLRKQELVDLDNRKGKAPGGYQSTLAEARVPFIFMNAVGIHRDVETMLHEAGHAFHALAARELPLHAYRGAPIEFCEVASMGMELLAAPHLRAFYSEKEATRARRDHLEGIIKFFPWMATVDAFQHWIYTHPDHTRAERTAHWLSLMDRFGGIEDWSGFERTRAHVWHRQLHIFEIPFYYVEYGIAQLGALQLWQASRRDLHAALDHYLAGLSLGGSRPLPELFQASGLAFDFTDKTIAPLMRNVKEALAEMADG
ncbi:MAG TPA: M3 family oligoendopeptidase [Candidatus Methylacidiphilales bacterium]|jgi:oligoendopeptidase F|nr:M3 family oligoendopeptidase [Candidatus Methylacidiphilales bacterium]